MGAAIWQELFAKRGIEAGIADMGSEAEGGQRGMKPGERIFFYDGSKNWWSRNGGPSSTPMGDPCGPDSEVFYEFDHVEHDEAYGHHCHPNCDCGRFMEIGNQVFTQYVRTEKGFELLSKQNVDFGGGLERIAAAAINSPDVFRTSLFVPIIAKLEEISGKRYDEHKQAMRVIADHLRAATFLAVDLDWNFDRRIRFSPCGDWNPSVFAGGPVPAGDAAGRIQRFRQGCKASGFPGDPWGPGGGRHQKGAERGGAYLCGGCGDVDPPAFAAGDPVRRQT